MRILDFRFEISDWAARSAEHLLGGCGAILNLKSQILNPTLAYRPFLDPAPIDRYWLWLLPPLIVIVAVVYRAIKTEDLSRLPRGAANLALQIAGFMLLASIGLYVILRLG